jgi:DNA gyrase subunit A
MATNIPPHNLKEVIGGCLAYIDNTNITVDELMEHIPGPDFPTAAIINGKAGIIEAYRTGRGRIVIRAKASVETNEKTGRETIIITELPYQLNKARLIERIAELVKEKKVEGISELRDESDKDGLRVVIEVKRGEVGEVVLNNLYAQTQLQNGFSFNVVALVDGQPQTLNLKEMIHHFVRHRREVVTRRTAYLLRKARDRVHILEGLAVAIANIDEIIELIKSSSTPVIAKDRLIAKGWDASVSSDLMEKAGTKSRPDDLDSNCGIKQDKYYLSLSQAKAILELKLHRLTGMEHDKLLSEYGEKLDEIIKYLEILDNPKVLMQLIKEELQIVSDEFGDDRRTIIIESQHDLTVEDLISEEDRVVTISHSGYAKTQPLSDYQSQHRGGTGKSATAVKDDDFVEHLLIASTHSTILCFTNVGKVYWLKVYQIPVAGRNSKGRPMINLLPLEENERINSILPVSEYDKNKYIIMVTANGTVKKTSLDQYSRPRSVGLRAVDLVEGDYLVGSAITDGNSDVMLFSSEGKAVRFSESDVRSVGRVSKGVRGMRLPIEHKVLSMIIPADNGYALTVSASGYGKRTNLTEFPTKGRGGKGMIAMQASKRNGPLVGVVQLFDRDEIMLISDQGTMVRTRCDEISVLGRNTQGVRVIRLRDQEIMVGLARVEEQDYADDFESED